MQCSGLRNGLRVNKGLLVLCVFCFPQFLLLFVLSLIVPSPFLLLLCIIIVNSCTDSLFMVSFQEFLRCKKEIHMAHCGKPTLLDWHLSFFFFPNVFHPTEEKKNAKWLALLLLTSVHYGLLESRHPMYIGFRNLCKTALCRSA